jgi:predicted transcriptional regulator YdeE
MNHLKYSLVALSWLLWFTPLTRTQDLKPAEDKTMTAPTLVRLVEKKIIGVEARTTNRAEANPGSAKIGALWQKFFQVEKSIPNRKNTDTVLAAYTRYESDYNGEYSIIVSSEVSSLESVPDGMVGATVPAARYLVFKAEGQMPGALIETWSHIWRYFSEKPPYERTYTTDLELHDKAKASRVDVYIALK